MAVLDTGCDLNQCSTPEGVTDSITAAWDQVKDYTKECSTPEGVTDSITSCEAAPMAIAHTCSTPEGVTDSITRGDGTTPAPAPRAQRPKASLIRSPVEREGEVVAVRVLNARRRH